MEYEGEFNSIKFNSYLVSADGVEIVLYPEAHHTKDQIKRAKQIALGERDVVRFRVESKTHRRDQAIREPTGAEREVLMLIAIKVDELVKLLGSDQVKAVGGMKEVGTIYACLNKLLKLSLPTKD